MLGKRDLPGIGDEKHGHFKVSAHFIYLKGTTSTKVGAMWSGAGHVRGVFYHDIV